MSLSFTYSVTNLSAVTALQFYTEEVRLLRWCLGVQFIMPSIE